MMPTLRLRWRGGESLGLDVLWQGKLDRTNTARKAVAYVSSLSDEDIDKHLDLPFLA